MHNVKIKLTESPKVKKKKHLQKKRGQLIKTLALVILKKSREKKSRKKFINKQMISMTFNNSI